MISFSFSLPTSLLILPEDSTNLEVPCLYQDFPLTFPTVPIVLNDFLPLKMAQFIVIPPAIQESLKKRKGRQNAKAQTSQVSEDCQKQRKAIGKQAMSRLINIVVLSQTLQHQKETSDTQRCRTAMFIQHQCGLSGVPPKTECPVFVLGIFYTP